MHHRRPRTCWVHDLSSSATCRHHRHHDRPRRRTRSRPGLRVTSRELWTRFGAFVIDIDPAATLFALGAGVVEYIVSGVDRQRSQAQRRADPLHGRSGRMVVPLQHVSARRWRPHLRHGRPRPAGRAGGRERSRRRTCGAPRLVFPLSFLLFGLGFLLILLRSGSPRDCTISLVVRPSCTPGTPTPCACGFLPGAERSRTPQRAIARIG